MSKITKLNEPTREENRNTIALNRDDPLNYLDIQENAGHTHIVDTQRDDTGIKTQKPVCITNDMTEERAPRQYSTISEMNQLYQDTMR